MIQNEPLNRTKYWAAFAAICLNGEPLNKLARELLRGHAN